MATVNGITFKPKQVSKRLLSVLPPRAQDVLVSRFGLSDESKPMTLEAIGQTYDITRERVRQIENHATANIKKSDVYAKEKAAFEELDHLLHTLGGVVAEHDFLGVISKDPSIQNHVSFLMALSHTMKYEKEDDHFAHRWYIDEHLSRRVHEALKLVYENLSDEDLVQETDMIAAFLGHVKDIAEEYKREEIVKRWLSMSKKLGKNPLGEWGRASSPNVRAKGIRDYAFLVIRKHGSPIHFTQVAKAITDVFKKKAHIATTHNELIKDKRFVLVGRGLYALSEWGYMSGVVRDVIKKVLDKNGPLTKQEVIEKVLKERYVKENTIVINLQNPKFFKKGKDGKYSIVESK